MIRFQNESLALVGATVIDGMGPSPNDDAVILIEKARIIAVGQPSTTQIPDRFQHYDLKGLTVLPGLIDSHVHITFALPRGPDVRKPKWAAYDVKLAI